MDRKRIREEVIEILANKLHALPRRGEEDDFDYDSQVLVPDVTKDPLDVAEVSMDLEDAFGVNFEEVLPGDAGMETIAKVVDYIEQRLQRRASGATVAAAPEPAEEEA